MLDSRNRKNRYMHEVSMLSPYVTMTREGHLSQVYHIFTYLKINHNARIIMDPSFPHINEVDFEHSDWSSYYGTEKEAIQRNTPEQKGKEFIIRAFIDASFGGYKLTRRSWTGLIVFIKSAPIFWFSKKQGSCEIGTSGSKFVAIRQCCEYVRGLRYKLKKIGILVNNPALIYGDNQNVLWNTKVPDSTLKKKSSVVAYHFCREDVTRNEWVTNYVRTKDNYSDIKTKCVTNLVDRK